MGFTSEVDAGVVPVKIGSVEKKLDLLEVLTKIEDVRATAGGDNKAYWDGLKKMLVDYGYPPETSLVVAANFARWHSGELEKLGKADPGESQQGLPGSTVPPSSTNPPTSS